MSNERFRKAMANAHVYLREANPRMTDLLRNKVAHGCRIRVALVDPDSPEAAQRDAEERLGGGLLARIRTPRLPVPRCCGCDSPAPTASSMPTPPTSRTCRQPRTPSRTG